MSKTYEEALLEYEKTGDIVGAFQDVPEFPSTTTAEEIAKKYTAGRYGSELRARCLAKYKRRGFDDFATEFYDNRPIKRYANYLICPCGSNYRQEGKEVFCTRKKCYRHTHALPIQTAKTLFVENENQTEEYDKPAGNRAVFDYDGVVKVIMRDNQYV